jgi:hypothetical protein
VSKRKEVETKFCAECLAPLERKRFSNGTLETITNYNRRKFCDAHCMGISINRPRIKPEKDCCDKHCRTKARRKTPPGMCEKCRNRVGMDVHHIDHDVTNNNPSNLMRICRSCHVREHRPMDFSIKNKRVCLRSEKQCFVCGSAIKIGQTYRDGASIFAHDLCSQLNMFHQRRV